MSRREVTLGLKKNSIVTLSYEDFEWSEFLARLRRMGIEIVKEEKIPCG